MPSILGDEFATISRVILCVYLTPLDCATLLNLCHTPLIRTGNKGPSGFTWLAKYINMQRLIQFDLKKNKNKKKTFICKYKERDFNICVYRVSYRHI